MRRFGGWVRQTIGLIPFHLLLVLFGITCLLWSLPAVLLKRMLPRRAATRLGQSMIMTLFRCYLAVLRLAGVARFDLSALDGLRRERCLVIAANHPSLLDAVMIISRLPQVTCILKARILDNLFFCGGASLASYIRNDTPLALTKRAAAEVRGGQQLLIFPEGTRTARDPIGPFKGGFALIARLAGAPVQTVILESNTRFLSKGWPLFRKPAFPLVYRARLGRRFDVSGSAQAFAAELEAYFRSELVGAELVGAGPPPGPERICAFPETTLCE